MGGRTEPVLGWRVQPLLQWEEEGQERSLLAAVEAWDGGASSTAPAHLPSVSPQVVPHPFKTHRDALAPLEKLCLSLLDVK